MILIIERYFLLFFVLAVAGWCMEVAWKFIQYRRFINRGFLIGPYCPIYGVGGVLITLLLTRYKDSPVVLFVMGMFVCGVLEYLTGYLMEKLFHARWWDYSNARFNLNGRVCAETLLIFGLLGLVLVYGIEPALFHLFDRLSAPVMHALCAILLLIISADVVVSSTVLSKIRRSADQSTGADDTETLTRMVREKLSQQGRLLRRTLRAFPTMKLYNVRLIRQMRLKQEALKKEAQEKSRKLRAELDNLERRLRKRSKNT